MSMIRSTYSESLIHIKVTLSEEQLAAVEALDPLIQAFSMGETEAFEELLGQVEVLSAEHGVPEEMLDRIATALEGTPIAPDKALDWVETINAHPSPLTYRLVNLVHLKVRDELPLLQKYFYVECGRTKISPEGFKEYARRYEPRLHPPIEDIELAEKGREFLESEMECAAFPVYEESGSTDAHFHYTSVYMKKTRNGEALRVVMSDSLGNVVASVHEQLTKLPVRSVYVLEQPRQSTSVVCSAFAFSDLHALIRLPSPFKSLRVFDQTSEDYIDYKLVRYPPPSMVAMCQSMHNVETYIRDTDIADAEKQALRDHVRSVSPYCEKKGAFKRQNHAAHWVVADMVEQVLKDAIFPTQISLES